ncbi:hypothetical protein OJF2_71730 [Aquisphaera giovannonii]|uniref:DUF4349 domain-containing protein n=1 Tax=Aquisphaera giovannonii TaxID=406548 RepID=A0A5B9WEB2_9BACT|nr:DUF4349 domain-containing protein [Aquisphaera giovannonii]QEH38569.1 hypothetical protein OJF2_71730 [Aquisphaera giovannonii]
MTPRVRPLLLVLLALAGCGSEYPSEATRSYPLPAAKSEAAAREAAPADRLAARTPPMMAAGAVTAFQEAPAGPAAAAAAMSRKIIYDGEIDLIVKDVDPIARQINAMVQEARGYIAEQSTTGSPGSVRSMRWKLRVPVERFDSLVEKLAGLGELEKNTRTSQDVTEQFYDVESRIKNKKAEEKSLTKILDERTGKLEEILKIETELSRVRGEIEVFEGRLRMLDNLSSLATLTVSIREREKFEPPPPAVADFSTQVSRTWESSIKGMIDLGKWIILGAVAWAIWIPFYIVGAIVAWMIIRWAFRRLPRLIALANTPLTIRKPQND